jgi:3-oxoacyl-[acyl-carrier-protein] synthase II
VGGIFAHATGTLAGDRAEGCALRLVFGDGLASVPVTAIKSALGHLMGAAGAVQAIVALKALEAQVLPPTLNLDAPDPLCPPDVVRGAPRPRAMDCALTNASGFGGHNVALVFKNIPSPSGRGLR